MAFEFPLKSAAPISIEDIIAMLSHTAVSAGSAKCPKTFKAAQINAARHIKIMYGSIIDANAEPAKNLSPENCADFSAKK